MVPHVYRILAHWNCSKILGFQDICAAAPFCYALAMLMALLLGLAVAGADRTAADHMYEHGQYQDAAGQYSKLVNANPNDASLLIRLGDCQQQIGQFPAAERSFRGALERAPDSLPAWVGLTEAFLSEGRPRDAMQSASRALRVNSNDRDARRAMAHVLAATNQFLQAEGMFRELTGSDPKDARSWFLLGELMYRGGYYHAAQQSLEKSLALQPANVRARIYRAVCLVKTGSLQEGEAQCKRLIDDPTTPKDLDLWLTYVELLYDSQRTSEALRMANQVIGFAPDHPIARYWLAKCMLQSGKLADASAEAERAVAAAPQLPFARTLLLQIYRKQGRTADAARQADWLREYEDRRARRDIK
jgi:tetratricopeptide (TPR) repeat protein